MHCKLLELVVQDAGLYEIRDWSKFPAPVVGIWVHIGEPLEATRGRGTRLLLDYMPHANIADFRPVKPQELLNSWYTGT